MSILDLDIHVCTFCTRKGLLWKSLTHAKACQKWFDDKEEKEKSTQKAHFISDSSLVDVLPVVLVNLVWNYLEKKVRSARFLYFYIEDRDSGFRQSACQDWAPSCIGKWIQPTASHSLLPRWRVVLLCHFCRECQIVCANGPV